MALYFDGPDGKRYYSRAVLYDLSAALTFPNAFIEHCGTLEEFWRSQERGIRTVLKIRVDAALAKMPQNPPTPIPYTDEVAETDDKFSGFIDRPAP